MRADADFTQLSERMLQAPYLMSGDPSVQARDPAARGAYLTRFAARLPHVILLAPTR